MTAEIAVLNKECAALAADSMVTINTVDGSKTYNNSNKLFTLSKLHPVGVLTWGGTDIQTVPTELLIKEFRKSLHADSREHLSAYSADFVDFLRTKTPWGPDEDNANFRSLVSSHIDDIVQRFMARCEADNMSPERRLLNLDGGKLFDEVLEEFSAQVTAAGANELLSGLDKAGIQKHYPDALPKIVTADLEGLSPSQDQIDSLINVVVSAILSNMTSEMSCGIAVAGYGEQDYYPAIVRQEIEGFICGVLKVAKQMESNITLRVNGMILPLAQRAPADTFISGVDPGYQKFINDSISELFPGIATEAATHFGVIDADLTESLKALLEEKAKVFNRALVRRRHEKFIRPLLDTVALLDRSEMAALAENLVSITALKQKVTLETETVGGAIDVAVISKHDGFIWIKRKHYFTADRNPFFLQNYLRDIGRS